MDRTYTTNGRTFAIFLRGTPSLTDVPAWTVEGVTENGKAVNVPGLTSIISSSEDVAFARACERIDRSLK
jgi:hypothetical protein